MHIVIDSASDYTPKMAQQQGLDLVPLTVTFGEDTFQSGYEIDNEEFYRKLTSSKELPHTSQVNPYEFEKKYRELLEDGEEILSIHMSSGMSGTYQSAVTAKNAIGSDKITVVDSLNVSGGYGLLVAEAIRMRDEGATVTQIAAHLEDIIPRVRLYIILDTLEYLRKGGRISASVAFIGGVMGLHPVVSVANGDVVNLDKVRGKKGACNWCAKQVTKVIPESDIPMVVVYSSNPQKAEDMKITLREQGFDNFGNTLCMGPIVGTHGGPDAVGIMYVEKK